MALTRLVSCQAVSTRWVRCTVPSLSGRDGAVLLLQALQLLRELADGLLHGVPAAGEAAADGQVAGLGALTLEPAVEVARQRAGRPVAVARVRVDAPADHRVERRGERGV